MASESFDLVIAGGGIIGAACAAACSDAGMKVLVLERGHLATETTAAGMGHIVLMDDSEAQFALTQYSRRLWLDLRSQLPDAAAYEACGTLWVAADSEEMAEVHRKAEYYSRRGVRVQVLDSRGVAEAEPNLRRGLAGGLKVPDDGALDPPAAAKFLFDCARHQGATVRTHACVKTILAEGGVELADGSRISAHRVVNAAGPWSPQLTPGTPVRRRKGHLAIVNRPPGFIHHQIVELGYLKSAHSLHQDSVAFNLQPRPNGQLLVGSSRQFDDESPDVNTFILERMLRRALEYMPALGDLSAAPARIGHRAATPDKLPLIGPLAANSRVWLATGHEGLGITTALATGRLLADMLAGRQSEIPTGPYAPSRFKF